MQASWIELAIAAAGGGLFGTISQVLLGLKMNKRDDFSKITETWAKDNERLREQAAENEQHIKALEEDLLQLRQQMILLDSAHQDLPIPFWLKDVFCRMLNINDAYEDVFLKPRDYTKADYIGKDDYAVWPDEIAEAFTDNDRWVLKYKQIWVGWEDITNAQGKAEKWKIIKYPYYNNRTVIGIAGIAIPQETGKT